MTQETKPLFRIGGVYRDVSGRLNQLTEQRDYGRAALCEVIDDEGNKISRAYWRDLVTGRDLADLTLDCGGKRHLLPGELTLRNGDWVSVEEATHREDELTRAIATIKRITRAEAEEMFPPAAEPKREPLAYYAEMKEGKRFDPFPGFTARRSTNWDCQSLSAEAPTLPTQTSPDLAVDRIPFGSAYLLPKA